MPQAKSAVLVPRQQCPASRPTEDAFPEPSAVLVPLQTEPLPSAGDIICRKRPRSRGGRCDSSHLVREEQQRRSAVLCVGKSDKATSDVITVVDALRFAFFFACFFPSTVPTLAPSPSAFCDASRTRFDAATRSVRYDSGWASGRTARRKDTKGGRRQDERGRHALPRATSKRPATLTRGRSRRPAGTRPTRVEYGRDWHGRNTAGGVAGVCASREVAMTRGREPTRDVPHDAIWDTQSKHRSESERTGRQTGRAYGRNSRPSAESGRAHALSHVGGTTCTDVRQREPSELLWLAASFVCTTTRPPSWPRQLGKGRRRPRAQPPAPGPTAPSM